MEKIAIHIESYKNIRNQTFCFNPKFECKYDENKKEFNFKEKENYINIFPKDINITAIVGRNGTGKSSILKAFLEEIATNKNIFNIYEKENYIQNFKTIYWDYSITDEGFKDHTPFKNHDQISNNNFVVLPSKVDDNFGSKIDIHRDIQNLATNFLKIDTIDILIKDFFEIDNILIYTENEINSFDKYKSDDKNEIEYFKDAYIDQYNHLYKLSYLNHKNDVLNAILDKNIIDKNIIIDFISKDNKKLLFLSFGEIQLLKILCNIQSLINEITNHEKNVLFLLDELELGLHPQWQKMIINLLSKIKTKKNKKVYFVLTSHSPFILSDIPKENVIFLEKFDDKTEKKYPKLDIKGLENGNCINVSKHIELKTFGANIHTLLSDGFFMSDGLMGEFAKNKIKTIQITYKYILHRHKQKSLNKKEHKKSRRFIKTQLKMLWHIQSIIGERFLQTIMKNYLQEIEEILFGNEKAIDNEIERLENLKQSIKNVKN
ncbi:ATP-binding protein [Aliarcobacter butzleri]|uniref:AAA family ATPase n=1 Tax=Aliarcobacter butzleri TaxID=28197 RepID=UPI001EDEAA6A|nr:AAA family ATPase [Aliarcobacter butzleri]MCG3670753.1 ATP-binding protein [Aliarcobacter butzleri]